MTFSIDIWKKKINQRMQDWNLSMKKTGVKSIYAFISATALWPVVEAARAGDWAALAVLGSVIAGVGSNLIANKIQNWKDEIGAANEIAELASKDEFLRAELDALLDKLDVFAQARDVLSEPDKKWFLKTLHTETNRLGNYKYFNNVFADSKIIIKGKQNQFVGRSDLQISGVVNGDILASGSRKETNIYYSNNVIDPVSLRKSYLNRIFVDTSQLSLTGIDPKLVKEMNPYLKLNAVYTALLTHTPRMNEPIEKGKMPILEKNRSSALAELNRHRYLILLGDPGSGKSTFINFVAMCLAGDGLKRDDANFKLLTEPLPDENGEDQGSAQPWYHGALLPIRIILRDFAEHGFKTPDEIGTAEHLIEYINQELKNAAMEDYLSYLRYELFKKGGLLLLDGVDEVPDPLHLQTQIFSAIEDWIKTFPKCKVVVTCRIYAYQNLQGRLNQFNAAVLAPFSKGQICRFIDRWYTHISFLRYMNKEDAKGRAFSLKEAIFNSDRLSALAERPLLLTLIASLHAWRGGSLPEKREHIYAATVDLLLDWWESQRVSRNAKGEIIMIQPSLAEWLKVDKEKVRNFLNRLAYNAHANQPKLIETADIPESELVSGLLRISKNPEAKANPALLMDYLSQRAGLIISRDEGIYTFPHRTFQEYLAACYLTDCDYPEKIANLGRDDPNRWREVTLLAGAKAVRGTASAIWSLIDALSFNEPDFDKSIEADFWGALLAAQTILENVNLDQVSERNYLKIDRVKKWLIKIIQKGLLPSVELVNAGNILDKIGDLRFNPNAWHLPAEPLLGFIKIDAGYFMMGSDLNKDVYASDIEQPLHRKFLPSFYISRYPVTVAQFRAFVNDSSYKPFNERCLLGISNHPVVYVTLYDAIKYCEWLNEKLKDSSSTLTELNELIPNKNWHVTLPSEAEWEKSARGKEYRIYPWGNKFVPDLSNTSEMDIGSKVTVGLFHRGASPYGVLDMCGNIWEWTRSHFTNYSHSNNKIKNKLISPSKITPESLIILRGGSFSEDCRYARCAFRLLRLPDISFWGFGFRIVISSL